VHSKDIVYSHAWHAKSELRADTSAWQGSLSAGEKPHPAAKRRPKDGSCSEAVIRGWLGRAAFAEALRKERHRSDRTGSRFSLVVFEMRQDTQTAISSSTRDYDVRALIDARRVGLLLLDTSLTQARLVIDKILTQLCATAGGPEAFAGLQAVRIFTYPSAKRAEFRHFELRNTGSSLPRPRSERAGSEGDRVSWTAGEVVPLLWDSSCSPLGTVVMSTPLFLDLQVSCSHLAYRVAKRAMDIVGAAVGLVLTAPLLLVIAAAVRLTSKGPALFKQERIGYRGRPFTMFKFRTMRVGCDDAIHRQYVKKLIEGRNDEINLGTAERPLYKLPNDPRITAVGSFLRKTSLDELPQLINVLLGQMSLVGPRPPLPFEVESYKSWHLRRILEAKPGITGLWQVYGRSSTTFDEMVRLDLRYAAQRSLLLDLKLMFKTFAAVFSAKGAL